MGRKKAKKPRVESGASPSEPNSRPRGDPPHNDSESACAICLGVIVDLTCLSGCSHKYCWECIWAWSRVTNRCPTCKGKFSALHSSQGKSVEIAEKEQVAADHFDPSDWDDDESSSDNVIDQEAEEGESDDSNLSDSEIERQKENIRRMRGDLFNEHERFPEMDFGSDSEDSDVKRARRVAAERQEYGSDEEELRNIMQLEEYDSDDGFVVDDDEPVEYDDDEQASDIPSFERDEFSSESDAPEQPLLIKKEISRRRRIVSDSESEIFSSSTDERTEDVRTDVSKGSDLNSRQKVPPQRRRRVIDEDEEAPSTPPSSKPENSADLESKPPHENSEKKKKKKRNKKRGKKRKTIASGKSEESAQDDGPKRRRLV